MPGRAQYPSLSGKHVFITGGATGIGAALVLAFINQGAKVSFVDINRQAGEALTNDIGSQSLDFFYCDVRQIECLQASITQAAKQQGDIAVLINNVADDQRYDAAEINPQQWRNSLAINLDPAFFAAQSVQPMMQRIGGGSIVNFSSINALLGPENMPSYVTAKAALLGMTKALARDFGKDNIRVNALLPGWVVTNKQLEKWLTPEAEAQWMQQVCLNKRISAEDVASLALFLAADDSSLITSQQFVIDGGRT